MYAQKLTAFALLLLIYAGCNPANEAQRNPPNATPLATEEVAPPAPAAPTTLAATESADDESAPPATRRNAPEATDDPSETVAAAEDPSTTPLIPRQILFGNPDKAQARLSPKGDRMSFLAPVDGVLNIWVGPVDDPSAAKPVTDDKKRGIRNHFWAYTNDQILYTQDQDGNEDHHVYAINLATGDITDLTPLKGVRAEIEGVSEKFPDEIIVGLNDRDPQYHDLYKVNIVTGKRELIEKNEQFAGFVTDDDYRVRFASKMTDDGGSDLYEPDGQGGWKVWQHIDMEDTMTTHPAGFDKSGDVLYFIDSRGRDTGSLKAINLDTGEEEVLAADDRADVASVLSHPTEKTIEGVAFNYERMEWKISDPQIKEAFKYLETVADGEITVASRTLDDRKWIVAYLMDNGPVRYYLYDRDAGKATFLFTNRQALEDQPLVRMHSAVIPARDGLNLVSYYTLPLEVDPEGTGKASRPVPMVLTVHGGPWARDEWGYDPQAQLLTNRGYATLSVNFRGSTGFGKNFTNAGNKEWARKMHDDLLDAVEWAIEQGIADPDKIAIMGGSYGGYATLVGLTETPEVFACGVDVVGPSNLFTLLSTIPPYWAPALQMFKDRVGDPTTEEGKKLLQERSPLNFVEKIVRPLLIGQGANDPRVKQSEADQIVAAMTAKKIPVTYVLFKDEGHGFARPENSMAFNAVTELFLHKHLGGRFEPIGTDFTGSSIAVPFGAEDLPGLSKALNKSTP